MNRLLTMTKILLQMMSKNYLQNYLPKAFLYLRSGKKIGIIPVGKYRWQWNFVRILIGKSRWPLMLFIYLSLSNCLHGFIYCQLFFKLSNIFKKINIKGPYISSCRIMSFIYIFNYRPNLYSLFLS